MSILKAMITRVFCKKHKACYATYKKIKEMFINE